MARVSKYPKLFIQKSRQAISLRKRLGLNQSAFWGRVRVTQSGGSRYESGRNIPISVQLLLHLAYAPDAEAQSLVDHLRAFK